MEVKALRLVKLFAENTLDKLRLPLKKWIFEMVADLAQHFYCTPKYTSKLIRQLTEGAKAIAEKHPHEREGDFRRDGLQTRRNSFGFFAGKRT